MTLWDVNAAVFFRRGEAEHVVILVDGAAHGAQAVVTVGEGVWNGELLHPGGPSLLNNAYIRDVVGHHGVKADLQMLRIAGGIVRLENRPGHGLLAPLLWREGGGGIGRAVCEKHAGIMQFDHGGTSCTRGTSAFLTCTIS